MSALQRRLGAESFQTFPSIIEGLSDMQWNTIKMNNIFYIIGVIVVIVVVLKLIGLY